MSTEANISVTVKPGGDPLITVRADEPAEFVSRALQVVSTGMIDHALGLSEAAQGSKNTAHALQVLPATQVTAHATPVPLQQPVQTYASQTVQAAAPAPPENHQQAPAAPVWPDTPSCHHGLKTVQSGLRKDGSTWRAWACPSPKGTPDQCKFQFIKD